MPIVTQCSVPGCETLTMGPVCVEHDRRLPRVFARGRAPRVVRALPDVLPVLEDAVVELRRASEPSAAAPALR